MVPQKAASVGNKATRSNNGTEGGTARGERRDGVGSVRGGCAKGGKGRVLVLPSSRSACFICHRPALVPSSFVRQARARSSAPVSGAYLWTSVRYQLDPALDGSAGQSARARGSGLMSPRDSSPWRGPPLCNRWRHTRPPPPSPSPQSPPFPCRAAALADTSPRAAAAAWRCRTTRRRGSIDGRAARAARRLSRRAGHQSSASPPPTARGGDIDRWVAHPSRGS